MINYNNHNITALTYNGHSIKYVYGCGGNLVWGGEPQPQPMPEGEWKVKFEYNNGDTRYILKGNNTSAKTSDYSSYVAYWDGSQTIYDYEAYYLNKNNISAVTFNQNTTYICDGFISGSTSLIYAYVQNCTNNTIIGVKAFYQCTSLREVILCDAVGVICGEAFRYCTSMMSVTITKNVMAIGDLAFADSGLLSVTMIPTSPPNIASTIFYNDNLNVICVPSASVNAYQTAKRWSDYASLIRTC